MSVNGSLPASPHVPAWKRLGLKLKREDNVSSNSPLASANALETDSHHAHDKKRTQEHATKGRSEKRRKTESEPLSVPIVIPNPHLTPQKPHKSRKDVLERPTTQDGLEASVKTPKRAVPDAEGSIEHGRANSEQSPNKQLARRKSVTFTPDTKTEDGVSASNFFKAWSAEQTSDSNIDPALSTEEPQATPTPTKKEKKKKKSKAPVLAKESSDSQSSTATPDSTPAYVSYLTQFHQDRENWKFNKNKQTDLLKHFFSFEHLPSEHTAALVAYVAGLQGSSARQRLREQATEILETLANDPANQPDAASPPRMDTREGRKAAYDAALARQIARVQAATAAHGGSWETSEAANEMLRTAERGERADAVLHELLLDELHPERKQSGVQADVGGKGPVTGQGEKKAGNAGAPQQKKKRKSRTEVSDDSSSDSADSSSDESSDDSSDDSSDESGDGEDDGNNDGREASKSSASSGTKAASSKSKHKPIFDKALLDRRFGKK